MPARAPCDQVTMATRSPCGLLDRLTLSGAPIPRTTSHSVCPSATCPPAVAGGAPAGLSVSALASPGPPGAGIPGQAPLAVTRSSAETGLSGVSGGESIDTLRMNRRPGRENHSESFDSRSELPEHPATNGASAISAKSRGRNWYVFNRLSHHHFAALPWLMKQLCADPQNIIDSRRLLFASPPPALLVGLPVGDVEAARFAIGPGRAGGRKRLIVVAVEQ
jgi:hypothetical protein